jgi:hypothetical protein
MKLEYTLLTLFIAFAYGLIKQFLPDFPIPAETLLLFVAYVLAKLGVEIVGQPVRNLLVKAGFRGFVKTRD